jgi:hypothetical protein
MRSHGGAGFTEMLHAFFHASLLTQLLIDFLIPPFFVCILWLRLGGDALLWKNKHYALSLKESKIALTVSYAVLFALTIYGRYFYKSN